ncbi:hypothetical protein QUV83_17150 [Cellulomonas cellasea]|uniref:hypothetical protein n=1 Tax=Cellulomonas cellasea TaxID=43670 RepID=UPI0025A4CADE|nr:hypothetical protein [Cellulomonas cellasea]MDM8086503.1 hypothetical protein [Cellulomonas cellasea]
MRRAIPQGNRTILVMAGVAVASLVAGLGLSQLITSPAKAEADAAPPVAGAVTVPVESRVISNELTLRGDPRYDDPAQIRIETGEVKGQPVVTGQVPEVGSTIDAATVALEIAGRPVIVLPGALPTYRSLQAGVSGPDVLQLKAALGALGINAGKPDSDVYDAATAAGVVELYRKVGYQPPAPSKELKETLKLAQDTVRSAESELTAAQLALTKASAGATEVERLQADNEVRAAQRALAAAEAGAGAPSAEPGGENLPVDVDGLREALAVAEARRAAVLAGTGSSAESAQVASAQRALTDARAQLAEAKDATLTALPASEVVFLSSLPRRVDNLDAKLGSIVSGPVMTVSGATLEIIASATADDAALLAVGGAGIITVLGQDVQVTITAIEAPGSKSSTAEAEGEGAEGSEAPAADGAGSSSGGQQGRHTIRFQIGEVSNEQLSTLQGGQNLRVKVPVSSTGGEVLAVPLAALTAGPGGESRVERQGAAGATELVTVETGLAASGYVQIVSSQEPLEAGDLVVVGKRAADSESDEETEGAG